MGQDAIYKHALYQVNGEDIPVKVILKSPDQIVDFREAQTRTPANTMEVRVTEIAKPKARDDAT